MVVATSAGALGELEFWRGLGVAVLPGQPRTKGPWPGEWPSLPHEQTWSLSYERARASDPNLALRLGRTADGARILGHVDFDAIDGIDEAEALEHARDAFPGAPLLRTSAGRWRMYFWSTREIPDSICRSLGAEIAANCRRLSIVHGVHPSGSRYQWIEPPSGRLPVVDVDVDAAGLVLESKAKREGRSDATGTCRSSLSPASDEQVRAFESLMSRLGIERGGDDEYHECPWHAETEASLHVTWTSAVFHCFGCDEEGGIRRLRELVGDLLPPTCNPSSSAWGSLGRGLQLGGSAIRDERDRLADALSGLGEAHRAGLMRGCREATWDAADADIEAFACPNGDATPAKARTVSCDDPQCPSCMPWRLAADWRNRWDRREGDAPRRLTLAILTARDISHGLDDWSYLKRARSAFREWHRARGLAGGFYGVTVRNENNAWRAELLVAVSDDDADRLADGRAFTARVLGSGLDSSAVIRTWQQAYLTEATAWETTGELQAFRALTKGRRKFQGFGEHFACDRKTEREGEEMNEKPLSRVSGGSGKSAKQTPCCPRCGERLKRVGRFDPRRMEIVVAQDGVAEWRWRAEADGRP